LSILITGFNSSWCAPVILGLLLADAVSTNSRASPRYEYYVPPGKAVLVDGKLERDEWSDAKQFVASESISIFFKRDHKYLYIAVKPKAGLFSVDLYLVQNAGSVSDLHASAKLGERQGMFGNFPDWIWWNNRGWVANVSRVKTFEPREFLPDEAKEYQITMSRFRKSRQILLSADIQVDNKITSIASGVIEQYGRKWIKLQW
jgi:hypothetical protein